MMKCKKIKILIILLIVLFILSSQVLAMSEWIGQADSFIESGKKHAETEKKTTNTDNLQTGSEIIFNTLLAVGIIVVIAVGAILGIQFMTAGIDKRVEVKQSLFPYIISSVVLFGAFGIWKLVITIMSNITQ